MVHGDVTKSLEVDVGNGFTGQDVTDYLLGDDVETRLVVGHGLNKIDGKSENVATVNTKRATKSCLVRSNAAVLLDEFHNVIARSFSRSVPLT